LCNFLHDNQICICPRIDDGARIVAGDGTAITLRADTCILRGVTRTVLIELLRREGLMLEERAFTTGAAKAARPDPSPNPCAAGFTRWPNGRTFVFC